MKILFVSSGNSRYGIAPFIKSQGESLINLGHQVEFFTIKGKGITGYLKSIKPLKTHIKSKNYDVIHAHYGLTGLIVALCRIRKPIVLSIMGSDAYGSFDINGKRQFSSYIDMILTQIALVFSTKIIVKSNKLLKYIPYKKKANVLPNGVNFERFKPKEYFNSGKILFLADTSNPRKNFALLKEAFDLLDCKACELIAPYPIDPVEIPSTINNAGVLVLTSFNEGSPNIIKESMACNIPIVSTNVGDVEEVIKDTEGCFITSFDKNDLATKLKKALLFGKRTNGRANISHLNDKVIADKLLNIYKEAINAKGI